MNMIFGAHIYLWTDRWSDRALPLLKRAAGLGLGCLEILVGDDVVFDPALTRHAARDAGMELTVSPGALWPMECDISADEPPHRRRGMDWHRRYIDLTAEVGATVYCGAIYGHPGRVRRARPPADEIPRTAESLHILADYAQQHNVKLVLEPMSHFRTHLINTPPQAMDLISAAGHENLAVLLDTYHMVTEVRDYGQAVRDCRQRLWGIHACESDRGAPGGGLVPWTDLFAALRQIEFTGHMLLESYNSSLGDFAIGRGMFHNVCPDGDEFVRTALRFLKGQCGAQV